jgi:DNA polymerase-3 subunit alpha
LEEFYGSAHCHTDRSNFRLRDSTNRLDELCWYAAKELHHNFIAITDHETIATAIDCQKVEKKIREEYPDFKIIRGNEIYLCRNGLSKDNYVRGEDKFFHFIILAKDAEGHEQIRQLSTRAWLRCFKTGKMIRVPTYYTDLQEIVGSNPGHVIFSTACLGSKPSQLILDYSNNPTEEKYQYIKDWITHIAAICGEENFFLETQPSFNKEQIIVNKIYKQLSEELNFPVIITLDAHYLKKEDEPIHHAFLTSQEGERETSEFYASTYMMSREEIHSYMDESISKETVSQWLNNTKKIYDMCEDYDLTKPTRIVYIPLTVDTITKDEYNQFKDKIKELEYFYKSEYKENRDLAAAIVRKIIIDPEQYNNQLTYEAIDDNLKAIRLASEKMNTQWSAYLLNLRDYVNVIWEKGNSLVGPARGSGTGFLLLNMLGVTQINPLRETTRTYSFRFLNPERVSPLDVDIDIEGAKRSQVYKALQDTYGHNRVSKVLTIRTEKSKSAILTAARGLGLDPEEGTYLASFIKSDRGQARTLEQTYYGDEENGIAPDLKFRELMDGKYKELWEVAKFIGGLCCGMGSHAGGVIFFDEDITKTTAQMQTTNGDIITQYDLHTVEEVGELKIDLLSIEGLDRERACLDLLVKQGYIDGNKPLRQIYEDTIGVYNLDRTSPEMWQMIHEHKIESLFQMEQQSGVKGIAAVKPTSIDDLAALNAVIRLMAPEKGAEQPIEKFARFKANPQLWYQEMDSYGVSKSGQKVLENILGISYGLCIQQEQFMMLVQQPEIGGFSLLWSDRLRKAISKKKPLEYEQLTKEFYEQTKEKNCEEALCKYVWEVLIAMNRGYGFNAAHTLAYSIVGLQEMNLAYKYPIIFWDTANLIVDSGAMGITEEILDSNDEEEEEENSEETDEEDKEEEKLKNSSTDYGRIAAAIGKMEARGLSFAPPNINKSDVTFSPDLNNNKILYGMKGITRIGNQLIKDIFKNRPYTSIEDFIGKVKVNKTQMTSLIKAGVFDDLYSCDRKEIMDNYLSLIADKKKRITLQNMQMLIAKNMIPEELNFEQRLFNFNKYLKKNKEGEYYRLDNVAMRFYSENYDEKFLNNIKIEDNNSTALIPQYKWDSIYKNGMEPIRVWMKANQQEILNNLNNSLLNDVKEKYAIGNISKWEMDSLSFYYHDHELSKLKTLVYDIDDYTKLPDEPEIERTFTTDKGDEITIYKIHRIAGTVIDKNKNKGTVTLLTTSGVVIVKVWKNQFTAWDKLIFEKLPDGKKKIIERSWFTRGNKLIITGIKRDNTFVPKKYKNTIYPLFEKIEELDDNGFIISSVTERAEVE